MMKYEITKAIFAAALTVGISSACSPASAAGDFQSLTSIRLQAEAFILNYGYESPYPPRFQLGNLDSRLRLKACRDDLKIGFARPDITYGNTALTLRCPQKPYWKVHLPAKIEVFEDVAVSARPLLKGQYIDDAAFRFEKRNVARLKNGFFIQQNGLGQLQAKRNLKRGAVLTPANLEPRLMVRSGQQVTLVLNYNGLQVKSSGKALQSAGYGQVVKVRNSQSQKIVEGIVSGEALVQVSI